MYNIFVSKDAEHSKNVLAIVVEYMIGITTGWPYHILIAIF